MTTLLTWVLFSAEMSSNRGTGVSAGAPCAVAAEVEAMALTMVSTPSKKPSIGVLAIVGISSLAR